MMPPQIVTDPAGRPLGPNPELRPEHLEAPGYEWLVALGVEIGKMPMVLELNGASCVDAVAQAGNIYTRAAIGRLALPVGSAEIAHWHRDDPTITTVIDLLGEPCPCGRPEHETISEADGIRAALIAGDNPILVVIQGLVLPGGWTPGQVEAIAR